MVDRQCLHCGRKFQVPYPSSKRLNCSEECRIARLRQPGRKRRADTGTRKTHWVALECPECRSDFEEPPWRVSQAAKDGSVLCCSAECLEQQRKRRARERSDGLPKARRLRGKGRHINNRGYAMIYVPPNERPPGKERAGYHVEHRVVMARILGRWPHPQETIHHINGDKQDNRPENLQLRSGSHGRGHVLRCRCCGSSDIEHIEL